MRDAKDRMLASENRKFVKLCNALLVELGAAPPTSSDVMLAQWTNRSIDTPLGKLQVTVYEDWLACRFEEMQRAVAGFAGKSMNLNQYSGKYNCHVFHRCTAKEAIEHLVRPHLATIWWVCGMDQPNALLQKQEKS